jgi:hypothetical protein
MKETQTKYYWNEDTINHFKEVSNNNHKMNTIEQMLSFVQNNCELKEGETYTDLAADLYFKVFGYWN